MGHVVYVRSKKTKAGEPGMWNEKKRLEVLTTFLATGSQAYTSAITKVPEETIRTWRKSDWWEERTKEIKNSENTVLDNKLTKVMDKALEAVMDRLENGEYILNNKTGEIRRVQAKLRDVQKVASDVIDKKQLLQKVTKGERQEKQQITADHLVMLAKEFAKFATGKTPTEASEVKTIIEGEHEEVFDALGLETNTQFKEKQNAS